MADEDKVDDDKTDYTSDVASPKGAGEKPYTVGYKNPPKHGQFRKGDPRHSQRRTKPKKTMGRVIEDEFNRLRAIDENGQPRRYTNEELIVRRLVNAAVKGDLKAAKLAMEWRIRFQDSANTGLDEIGKDDAAILEAFLRIRETT